MYAPPEQLLNEARKPSDVYSLGMVAARICIGDRSVYDLPNDRIDYRSLLKARRRPFEEMVEMNPILEEMEPIIVKAVGKDAFRRYQSPGEFAEQLAEAYRSGTVKQNKTTIPLAKVQKTIPYPETPEPSAKPVAPTKPYPADPPRHKMPIHPEAKLSPRKYVPPMREKSWPNQIRKGRLAKLLVVSGLAISSLLGATSVYDSPVFSKEAVTDFVSDDREELAHKIIEADATDKQAFMADLRAFVDEEVQQARASKYDTRPIRIMAGDKSLAEDYLKDRLDASSVVGIDDSLEYAAQQNYIPTVVAAYGGVRPETMEKYEPKIFSFQQDVDLAQIHYWLDDEKYEDRKEALSNLDMVKEDPNPKTKCTETTYVKALIINEDTKLAKLGMKECAPQQFYIPYILAGRLAVVSGDLVEVQQQLSKIFNLSCRKEYYLGFYLGQSIGNYYLLNENPYYDTERCTDNQKYATATDAAAHAILYYSRHS